MTEVIKETVVARDANHQVVQSTSVVQASPSQTVEYLVYFVFGLLEILLAFRLILKIMGASTASGFVSFVYGLTKIFILPFEGIFRRLLTTGVETTAVFEPATLVALIVYAVIAWGVVQLIRILSRQQTE